MLCLPLHVALLGYQTEKLEIGISADKDLRCNDIVRITVKPGYKNTIGTREYILIREVILILKNTCKISPKKVSRTSDIYGPKAIPNPRTFFVYKEAALLSSRALFATNNLPRRS